MQSTQPHSGLYTGSNQPQYPKHHDGIRSTYLVYPHTRTTDVHVLTRPQTGGLLSDVFLHLVPHSFMGEHQGGGVHFVMVEEKRNILIGYVCVHYCISPVQ